MLNGNAVNKMYKLSFFVDSTIEAHITYSCSCPKLARDRGLHSFPNSAALGLINAAAASLAPDFYPYKIKKECCFPAT